MLATGPFCRCGTITVIGSSIEPHCPRCDRAYHALEVRHAQTGIAATIEELIDAMIADGRLAAAGVDVDGSLRVRLSAERSKMNDEDTELIAWAHEKPRRLTDGLLVPAIVALAIVAAFVSSATSHRLDQPTSLGAIASFTTMCAVIVVRLAWNLSRMSRAVIAESSRRDRVRALGSQGALRKP